MRGLRLVNGVDPLPMGRHRLAAGAAALVAVAAASLATTAPPAAAAGGVRYGITDDAWLQNGTGTVDVEASLGCTRSACRSCGSR